MLDFLLELDQLLKLWPDNTKQSLVDIAEQTATKVPHVVGCMSEVLPKCMDVHEPLTFNEVSKAHIALMDRHRGELEAMRQRQRQAVEQSILAFDKAMDKVHLMEAAKNWRGAYKTLTYFYGMHNERLPSEYVVSICNECLRLGIKESINFQELSQWLKRGIHCLLNAPGSETIEDALDFIDAYGDYFLTESKGRGEKFLTNIFLLLKPAAMEFDLSSKLNEIAQELNLTAVMDVYI
jgi:hypothetical protein